MRGRKQHEMTDIYPCRADDEVSHFLLHDGMEILGITVSLSITEAFDRQAYIHMAARLGD